MEAIARPSEAAAGTQASAASADPGREYLTFRLGDEEYGIDILRVKEIRSYEAPMRIANAPAFIRGVVNLRGVIVPVVDLRLKFRGATPAPGASGVIVVLNVSGRVVGAVVDSVSDVIRLGSDHIKPPPNMPGAADARCITGVARMGERMLVLMDIEALMAGADMGLVREAPIPA